MDRTLDRMTIVAETFKILSPKELRRIIRTCKGHGFFHQQRELAIAELQSRGAE